MPRRPALRGPGSALSDADGVTVDHGEVDGRSFSQAAFLSGWLSSSGVPARSGRGSAIASDSSRSVDDTALVAVEFGSEAMRDSPRTKAGSRGGHSCPSTQNLTGPAAGGGPDPVHHDTYEANTPDNFSRRGPERSIAAEPALGADGGAPLVTIWVIATIAILSPCPLPGG